VGDGQGKQQGGTDECRQGASGADREMRFPSNPLNPKLL